MISRTNRFHGHNSLRFVYQHGHVVRGPFYSIRYAVNERRKTYRTAIVVSRKVSKSAVTRNRIRRRLYEIVRQASRGIEGPYDIVITVFNEQVASMPAPELEKGIKALMRRAGIISSRPRQTQP